MTQHEEGRPSPETVLDQIKKNGARPKWRKRGWAQVIADFKKEFGVAS